MSHPVSVLEMSPQEVHRALINGQVMLVDVREPQEYAAERIHGALLFPLSTFDAAFLPGDDERRVVFHCAGGVRSMNAAMRRLAAYGKAAHMKGGIAAWKAAGLPTVRVDPATGQVVDAPA
ncbi:MAG TPA: rhodanese-like domain-containing protein [Steroidobacteraceae bacterium]|nr:rhodanese-like domain-containing protein [Steroidobacteraceae bacterium]